MKNKEMFGFTLIELLAAVAIVAVLTTVTLAGFSQGNKTRGVVLGTDVLIGSIRTAQNASLNPQPIANSGCSTSGFPLEYHLKFNSVNPVYYFTATDKCNNSINLQTFSLPKNVRLKINGLELDGTGVGNGGGTLDLKFLPPFGTMTASVNGGAYVAFNQTKVTLESNDSSIARFVTLDGLSGRVDTNSVATSAIPAPPAPTINFSASAASSGVGYTLTWTVSNADTASINNGVGIVSTSGSKDVNPANDTTYILTATNAGGTTTAQATVTPSCPTPYTETQSYPAGTPGTMPDITGGSFGNLSTVTPTTVTPGITIKIDGFGFNDTAANDSVVFMPSNGQVFLATPTSVTAGTFLRQATVVVPQGLPSTGTINIRIVDNVTHRYTDGVSIQTFHLTVPSGSTLRQGQSGADVTIDSSIPQFTTSTSGVFGSGISVVSTTLVSPTRIIYKVDIGSSAALGRRVVGVTDVNMQGIVNSAISVCRGSP